MVKNKKLQVLGKKELKHIILNIKMTNKNNIKNTNLKKVKAENQKADQKDLRTEAQLQEDG